MAAQERERERVVLRLPRRRGVTWRVMGGRGQALPPPLRLGEEALPAVQRWGEVG